MAEDKDRIQKSYLILCEGIDVKNFLIFYLNSKALKYDSRFSNDIQAFDFKGIEELQTYLGNLVKMEGFDQVRQILVLRDAETDVQKAVNMVNKAFCVNGFAVPEAACEWKKDENASIQEVATAFALLPTCDSKPTVGALEDLCWDILKNERAQEMKGDIQGFINEIKQKYRTVSTHEHKSRVHAYFSVNEGFISLKIGEAAKAGAFDWESNKLDGLKSIIAKGFET